MKRVVPKVFLVGQSAINHGGIEDYLKHAGTKWRPAMEISHAEMLTEFMGRLCYRSWEPGMNPNVTRIRTDSKKYIGNILKVKHGSVLEHAVTHWVFADVSRVFCFHPSTEILTKTGWSAVENLIVGQPILTMNPKTRLARWSPVRDFVKFDYDGDVYGFESSQWKSPKVTPEHTLWCARYDLRHCRDRSCDEIADTYMEKVKAEEVFGKRIVLDHRIRMENVRTDPKIVIGEHSYNAGDFLEWLGWLVTDGNVSKDKNRCTISQSKVKNFPKIKLLMDRLFGDRWRFYPSKLSVFVIHDPALKKWILETLGRLKSGYDLTPLLEFSPDLLRRFVDGAVLGDGSIHENGHVVLYSGYPSLSKGFQSVLAACGMSSNIRVVARAGQSHSLRGKTITWNRDENVVSIHKKGVSLVHLNHWTKSHYSGFVYCPRTDDGLVYARSDGMAAWYGNTHELVRHRAGMAFSQESLRFVRLEDLGLWLPPEIEARPEVARLFEKTFESLGELQIELAKTLGLDEEGLPFGEKKKLTSAMRRVAPIGLATTIGVSANLRALRHIVSMRTAASAEAEVRLVIGQMMEVCRDKWPSVFQDFTKQDDGTWQAEFEKV